MMESNFFKEVGRININNGHFVQKSGPDYSGPTTVYRQNTTINDRSRRVTNYGGYKNYGQHADGHGQINNYGPQTTNNGPIHGGYRQYATNHSPYPPMNKWTQPSYNDDNYDDDFQAPARGQSHYQPPAQPDHLHPGDPEYFGRHQSASQSDSRLGSKRPKEPGFPRSKTEKPRRRSPGIDIESPQFREEYESMSPELKQYFRDLGFDPQQQSLAEGMSHVSLDDPVLPRTSSPGSFGRRTPDVPRKGKKGKKPLSHPLSSDDSDDSDHSEDDLEDYDSGAAQHYGASYTHNDNRVITKHINSHNVNTENVVDSYNDNSTRTDVRKNTAR